TGGAPLQTTDENVRAVAVAIGAAPSSTADLAVGSNACGNTSLAPGSTCTIPVSFTPTTAGTLAGSLVVAYNGASTLEAPLLGIGVWATTTNVAAPTVTYPQNGVVTVNVLSNGGTPTG